MVPEEKQRMVQEYVPGKQVTMAHLIANPNPDLYTKLGVVCQKRGALPPRQRKWRLSLSTDSVVLW